MYDCVTQFAGAERGEGRWLTLVDCILYGVSTTGALQRNVALIDDCCLWTRALLDHCLCCTLTTPTAARSLAPSHVSIYGRIVGATTEIPRRLAIMQHLFGRVRNISTSGRRRICAVHFILIKNKFGVSLPRKPGSIFMGTVNENNAFS